jgi:carbohydrate-selective porin OprB
MLIFAFPRKKFSMRFISLAFYPSTFTLHGLFFAFLSWSILPVCHAESAVEDVFSVHAQTTFNWQYHPAYSAAYTGPNSIITGPESMYTFSATAFLGIRPWAGGEFFYNTEMVEGVPFSTNLVGLGTYTNGEITRAGGTSPAEYRQRLFLRQTWNNGGGNDHVDDEANQFAEFIDKNRFVITVGNFSTLDVFDPNTFAKDPLTQFMNWGNWTYAAWDYAADARGYGWGFAAEWYLNNWALRLGRMSGPKQPNLLPDDFALDKHYGDQIEIEHAHLLNAHPGKVRVLAYHDRAIMASFNDAYSWLITHPGQYTGPDALYAVRNIEKDKYGFGINVEQEINDNLGYFLRAMVSDGHTETYAFTEVDDSISTGFAIKGNLWQRNKDTVGIAVLQNYLSNDRRRFLEAGGVSYFIGDGQLNYRPETIFESYYSFGLFKGGWLTPDYQFILNPAYNADRGPIHVFAFRFHADL